MNILNTGVALSLMCLLSSATIKSHSDDITVLFRDEFIEFFKEDCGNEELWKKDCEEYGELYFGTRHNKAKLDAWKNMCAVFVPCGCVLLEPDYSCSVYSCLIDNCFPKQFQEDHNSAEFISWLADNLTIAEPCFNGCVAEFTTEGTTNVSTTSSEPTTNPKPTSAPKSPNTTESTATTNSTTTPKPTFAPSPTKTTVSFNTPMQPTKTTRSTTTAKAMTTHKATTTPEKTNTTEATTTATTTTNTTPTPTCRTNVDCPPGEECTHDYTCEIPDNQGGAGTPGCHLNNHLQGGGFLQVEADC